MSRKLLSGSVLRLSNVIVAALAALLVMPLTVHRLGDRGYGLWTLAGAFIGYYGLIDLGLSSAVSQYLCIALGRKDLLESRAVFNTALALQSTLGGAALAVTAAIAFSSQWFCRTPADASLCWKVIAILGTNAVLGFPARVYSAVLEAELRIDIQGGLDLLGQILRNGSILCTLLAGGGLLALSWTSLLASVPIMILQVVLGRRTSSWARLGGPSFGRKRIKSFFSYSAYTFVSSIADLLRFQIDPLVITGFVGLAAVTHYRVAGALTKYYIAIVISSTDTFAQVMSRSYGAGDRVRLERVFRLATKVSICISIFIGFAAIAFGKPFILRWMGTIYEDAYSPMVVLSLAVLLDVGQCPSIGLLYATFNHRFYTYINLGEGIINLIVSIALAKPFGIVGVALGTLIAALLVRTVVQPWWVCKAVGLRYVDYMRFLGWNVVRCGFLATIAIAVSAWGLKPSYPLLIGAAVFATGVYAAGSFLFVFDRREREQLIAAVTRQNVVLVVPDPVIATSIR